MSHRQRLGAVGIWASACPTDKPSAERAAVEIEATGVRALWMPPGLRLERLDTIEHMLAATRSLVVTTAVVSMWTLDAISLAARHAALRARFGRRFVLGLGVSHAPLMPLGVTCSRPLTAMGDYLDELDRAPVPVGCDERVLAALGPHMLGLARDRSLGAHPLIVTPEHTRRARATLGSAALLAPGQKVVLERDPSLARARARRSVAGHLTLANYAESLRRLGFRDDDLADGGSDRLIDSIVAWGDVDSVRARIAEHLSAGADHVAIDVVGHEPGSDVAEVWRALTSGW